MSAYCCILFVCLSIRPVIAQFNFGFSGTNGGFPASALGLSGSQAAALSGPGMLQIQTALSEVAVSCGQQKLMAMAKSIGRAEIMSYLEGLNSQHQNEVDLTKGEIIALCSTWQGPVPNSRGPPRPRTRPTPPRRNAGTPAPFRAAPNPSAPSSQSAISLLSGQANQQPRTAQDGPQMFNLAVQQILALCGRNKMHAVFQKLTATEQNSLTQGLRNPSTRKSAQDGFVARCQGRQVETVEKFDEFQTENARRQGPDLRLQNNPRFRNLRASNRNQAWRGNQRSGNRIAVNPQAQQNRNGFATRPAGRTQTAMEACGGRKGLRSAIQEMAESRKIQLLLLFADGGYRTASAKLVEHCLAPSYHDYYGQNTDYPEYDDYYNQAPTPQQYGRPTRNRGVNRFQGRQNFQASNRLPTSLAPTFTRPPGRVVPPGVTPSRNSYRWDVGLAELQRRAEQQEKEAQVRTETKGELDQGAVRAAVAEIAAVCGVERTKAVMTVIGSQPEQRNFMLHALALPQTRSQTVQTIISQCR